MPPRTASKRVSYRSKGHVPGRGATVARAVKGRAKQRKTVVGETSSKPYRAIALGRLAAATRDAMGDTLGSFSSMTLEPGSWRVDDGKYSGVFVTIGDRGFNVPARERFSNYPTRVHRIAFVLEGSRLSLTPLDARYVRDEKGALSTGLDPGWGWTKQFGFRLPSPEVGPATGRISIDSEGLALRSDGTFFISDEFGANIYVCASNGSMTGVITPPEAFVPRCDGKLCFSSRGVNPDQGRSPNDGFEGIALSADGKRLFALLQNPLVQDRKGKPTMQRYTRLLVYDLSGKRLPREPEAHYVVELPLHGETIGGPMTEAAEANAIDTLDGDKFLVLTRESYGFGAEERHGSKSIVHKKVMFGSLEGASEIAGSEFERKAKSIIKGGQLNSSISPVRLTTFLDIADEEELNRVGLTAKSGNRRHHLLSAKWESLVLSPVLDKKRPRERLLFIGNDNDYRTRKGFMPDGSYDAEFEHDNFVIVYRITMPG
jgi:hypothetical protein